MTLIVGVHGAGHELWGPHAIANRWWPALLDGLSYHGADGVISPGDLSIAFYGDLFRNDPQARRVAPVDVDATMSGLEDVIHEIDPHADLAAITQQLVQHGFARLLAQADAYLSNDDLRSEVRARLEARITPDTRLVLAHSLGTIVAFETLSLHPEWDVDLLTIGTPLGGPVISPRLDPAPDEAGLLIRPPAVRRWTNVIDPHDPATGGRHLADHLAGPVDDAEVDNGHRPHDVEPYLGNPYAGGAVARALVGVNRPG